MSLRPQPLDFELADDLRIGNSGCNGGGGRLGEKSAIARRIGVFSARYGPWQALAFAIETVKLTEKDCGGAKVRNGREQRSRFYCGSTLFVPKAEGTRGATT